MGLDDEEGDRAGGAVDVFNDAEDAGSWSGTIDELTIDEITNVDFVRGKGRTLLARDGDDEAGEGFSVVDGVDAVKVEDDGALVQPVVDEGDGARGNGF